MGWHVPHRHLGPETRRGPRLHGGLRQSDPYERRRNANRRVVSYPSIGAVFALFKSSDYKGVIPPYVVLTQPQGRFSEEGFLGPLYKPFATGGDPNAQKFEVEGMAAKGVTEERQKARIALRDQLDTMSRELAASPQLTVSTEARKQANEMVQGGRDIFDLSKETAEMRTRYGRSTFGQDCLAARRMVEAGVPYVVINYPGGWDTHSNHSATMRRQCPQLDQGLAMLLQDLQDRGLLETDGPLLRLTSRGVLFSNEVFEGFI